MRDIPVFATEFGVASLGLREIPARAEAYVHIQDVQQGHLPDLLEECIGFCRAAGAETVFARGHEDLEREKLHCVVYEMSGGCAEGDAPASLWPVLPENVGRWRTIYNEKMKNVDHAATLTSFDEKKILESGGACFIHREGTLLGIGWMEDSRILAVASCVPGQGKTVLQSLMRAWPAGRYCLEVASTNERAVRLYEAMGFLKTRELERWYRVFG